MRKWLARGLVGVVLALILEGVGVGECWAARETFVVKGTMEVTPTKKEVSSPTYGISDTGKYTVIGGINSGNIVIKELDGKNAKDDVGAEITVKIGDTECKSKIGNGIQGTIKNINESCGGKMGSKTTNGALSGGAIAKITLNATPAVSGSSAEATTETEATEDAEEKNSCYDQAAALGWVLCPILSGLSSVTESAYNGWVEPALEVNSELITMNNPDEGTYGAWNAFRDIANVLFVILLLVVIFSQLTGVGIDNYGIKKILPKLIMIAVLTNMSYFICQALVDVSNVVGNGVQGILESMSPDLDTIMVEGTQVYEESEFESKFAYGVKGSVGLVALLGGAGGAFLLASPSIIITLLISMLSGLVSLFMLFLLLAVRKAAIVLLVAVSPIAAVSYVLPNVKRKVFDVWWKGLSALLLLYPICGLVIGGGGLASDIILSTGAGDVSFMTAITAYICAIAPIFFIPSMLKGSFKALGNIGATISGVGKAAKQGTVGRFAKSSAVARAKTKMNAVDPGGLRKRVADKAVAMKIPGGMAYKRRYASGVNALYRQNAEDLETETALMRNETLNYDPDTMAAQLAEMATSKGGIDELKFRALAKKLASSGGYGQNLLAKTMGNKEVDPSKMKLMAGFMGRDSDISAGIMRKDGYLGQYLREVNQGKILKGQDGREHNVKDMSYAQWLGSGRTIQVKDADGREREEFINNEQFVTEKVLTDDKDILSQSGSTTTKHIQSMNGDRFAGLIDNSLQVQAADKDVKTALANECKRRNMRVPSYLEHYVTSVGGTSNGGGGTP